MRVGYVDVLWQMRIGIKPLKPPRGNSHHVPAAAARAHPGYRTTMEACWRNCSEAAASNDGQRDTCVSDSCFTAAQAEDRKACREPYYLENSASRAHAVAYCSSWGATVPPHSSHLRFKATRSWSCAPVAQSLEVLPAL